MFLGQGAFGKVYLINNQAVKKIDVSALDEKSLSDAMQEGQRLKRLSHPNIVSVYDVSYDRSQHSVNITMEYCPSTLSKQLPLETSTRGSQARLMVLKWMRQLTDALGYLHQERIVHRDIKPDNILLTKDFDIKIADFGLATVLEKIELTSSDIAKMDSRRNTKTGSIGRSAAVRSLFQYLSSACGTPLWRAPEVITHRYGKECDIFSMGLVFYVLLTGPSSMVHINGVQTPGVLLDNGRCVGDYLAQGGAVAEQKLMVQLFANKQDQFQLPNLTLDTLIKDMLAATPRRRPTAAQVLTRLQPRAAAADSASSASASNSGISTATLMCVLGTLATGALALAGALFRR